MDLSSSRKAGESDSRIHVMSWSRRDSSDEEAISTSGAGRNVFVYQEAKPTLELTIAAAVMKVSAQKPGAIIPVVCENEFDKFNARKAIANHTDGSVDVAIVDPGVVVSPKALVFVAPTLESVMSAPWCDTVALVTPSKEVLAFFQKMSSKLPDASAQFEKVLNNAVDRIGEFFNNNNNSLTCFVYLGQGAKDGDQQHLDNYNKSSVKLFDKHIATLGVPLAQALRARRYIVTLKHYVQDDSAILYTTLEVVATLKQPSVTEAEAAEAEEGDGVEELRGD